MTIAKEVQKQSGLKENKFKKYGNGGAIYLNTSSWAEFTSEVTFSNNYADRAGGAIAAGVPASEKHILKILEDIVKIAVDITALIVTDGTATTVKSANYVRKAAKAERKLAENAAKDAEDSIASNGDGTDSIHSESLFHENATFSTNTVLNGNGGAVWLDEHAIASFEKSVTFNSNTAQNDEDKYTTTIYGGGAVFMEANSIFVVADEATFTNNSCTGNGYTHGGALFAGNNTAVIFGKKATFSNNSAKISSGASTTSYGGALALDQQSTCVMGDVVFSNNTADVGGAISIHDNKKCDIYGEATFENNHANSDGGAVYDADGCLDFYSAVVFKGNTAQNKGGALYVAGHSCTFHDDVTFTGNTANAGEKSGNAIYVDDGFITISGTMTLDAGQSIATLGAVFIWDITRDGKDAYLNDYSLLAGYSLQSYDDPNPSEYWIKVNDIETTAKTQYVLAGNASGANQAFYLLDSNDLRYAINVGGSANLNGYTYKLNVNSQKELVLTVNVTANGHIVVADGKSLTTDGTFEGYNFGDTNGGVVNVNAGGVLDLYNCVLKNNSAISSGGAVYNAGTTYLDSVTFNGNMVNGSASNGGAVYNTGLLRFFGDVTLSTNTDTIINTSTGTLDWVLATKSKGYVSDFSKISNTGTFSITLDPEQLQTGTYKLASNARSAVGKTFTINVFDGDKSEETITETITVTVDGSMNFLYDIYPVKLYVDSKTNELYLEIMTKKQIVVSDETFPETQGEYTVKYERVFEGWSTDKDGTVFYVESTGTLNNTAPFAIVNCTASGNGGAIYNDGGTVTLNDATFSCNKTSSHGGAIYNNSGTVTLNNATFSGNSSAYGGAICNSGTITITDSTFSGNTASQNGGAFTNEGAPITNTTIRNTVFSGNTAVNGGAIRSMNTSSLLTLDNVTFNGNTATTGGAIYCAHTINIEGAVILKTNTDTIYSDGTLNWNLAAADEQHDFCISNMGLVSGNGSYTITVSSSQKEGEYLLGKNAAGFNKSITLKSDSGTSYGTITVNGSAVKAGNLEYKLVCDEENNLVLLAGDLIIDQRITVNTTTYSPDGVCTLANGTVANVQSSGVNGGAFYVEASGTLTNEGKVSFIDSNGDLGGAIYVYGKVSLDDVEFINNHGNNYGGAVCNESGANVTITNAVFKYNTSNADGGAILNDWYSTLTLRNVEFTQNSSYYGGGAIRNCNGSTITMSNVTFDGNKCNNSSSGAIRNEYSTINIEGKITLKTNSDTIQNVGTINWNLAAADGSNYDYSISNWSLVSGSGSYTVTVKGSGRQHVGTYTLAKNVTGTFTVTVKGADSSSHTLSVSSSKTSDSYQNAYQKFTLQYSSNTVSMKVEYRSDVHIVVKDTTYSIPDGISFDRTGNPYTGSENGGIFYVESTGKLTNSGSVSFINCTISNTNLSGGAVYNNGGTVSLKNATFSCNKTSSHGGAIYNNSGTVTLNNATFSGNSSAYGGAICNSGTITITDSTFSGNTASQNGGAFTNEGTPITNTTIRNTVFSGNTAVNGGAIRSMNTSSLLTLDNVTFNGNTATTGGAIYCAHTINIEGKITLKTEKDTIYNGGTLNWNLAAADGSNYDYSISNWGVVSGSGSYTVTVGALGSQVVGTYDLADLVSDSFSVTLKGAESGDVTMSVTQANDMAYYVASDNRSYKLALVHDVATLTIENHITVSPENFPTNGVYTIANGKTYNFTGRGGTSEFGGVFLIRGKGTLNNGANDTVSFTGSTAERSGGAIASYGTVELNNATFTSNSAVKNGGAVYLSDGNSTFTNSTFSKNSATDGGAIDNEARDLLTLTNVLFSGNIAKENGGAIRNYNGGQLRLANVKFSENKAGTELAGSGGAIFNDESCTVTLCGEVTLDTDTDTIVNKGTLNWDMTAASATNSVCLNGLQRLDNEDGLVSITVSNDLAAGEYVMATANASGVGPSTFELNGAETYSTTITVGGGWVRYGEGLYQLNWNDNNELVFQVAGDIKVANQEIWYNAKDPITLGGLCKNLVSVSVEGNAGTVNENTWSCTFNYGETPAEGKEIRVSGVDIHGQTVYSDPYTLKVDGSAPKLTITRDPASGASGKNTVTVSATAVDTHSGLDTFTYSINGGATLDYTKPLVFTENGVVTFTATDKVGNVTSQTYAIQDISIPYTVSQALNTTYDGNEHSVYVVVNDPTVNATVFYSIDGGTTWISTPDGKYTATDAEKVNVQFKITADRRATVTTETVGFNIAKRNITVTSGSASREYDGTALTNGTVTVTGGSFVQGEGATYTVTGSQTAVGSSDNTFNYTLNANTKEQNYNITSVYGTLEVTKNTTPITITADSGEWTYDGTAHIAGYSFTQGVLAEGDQLSVTVEGSITQAGTATSRIAGYQVLRYGKEDVTSYYTFTDSVDGTLTVNKAEVYLKSSSAHKEYDGTALTSHSMAIETGLVAGENFVYNYTGTQTTIGSSANTYTYAAGEGTSLDNYNVTAEYGTLEVLKAGEGYITITANSDSKIYDGNTLSNGGYTYTEGILAEGHKLFATVEGSITDAGVASNKVTSYLVLDSDDKDVTDNYTFVKVDGRLTVERCNVTLSSGSSTREYNGGPLTNETITVSDGSFALGEGAAYIVTGSQTLVGSSKNTFNYTLHANTKAENYNITLDFGTLEVTENTTPITITANSGTWTYDGTEHTAGYSYTGSLATGDELVVTVNGAITNAGSTSSSIAEYHVIRGGVLDVTDFYTNISTAGGTLTVNQADLYLKSSSATKQYDGTALTSKCMEVESGLMKGESLVYIYTGSQTKVGSSDNTFIYAAGEGTVLSNYSIKQEYGTLTVEQAGPIIIQANSVTKTYDGLALTNGGYTYQGTLAAGDALVVNLEGSITDAGAVLNHVAGYKVMRGTEDVTANYTFGTSIDGILAVTPRNITLTSGSDSQMYDGTSLTNETITVSGDGFVQGEGANYIITGSQTLVGTSSNTFNYTFDANTKSQNYNIASVYGTLEVTKNTTPITITASSGTWTYDGTEHTAGYTFTPGVLGVGDELVVTVEGAITDAGTVFNRIASYKVTRYDSMDVTDLYTFTSTVNGTLTVNKADVYLKSSSATKEYDGRPLTSESLAVQNGIVAGESFVYTYTGSQTAVGTSANTFTYAAGEGTNLDNYNITAECGTLEVTENVHTIVIQANSNTKTYDGSALTDNGYTFTQGILAEGDVLSVTVEGTVTDAGTAVNKVTGYKVLRNGTEDVTSYYTFAAPIDGVLTVTPRDITFTSEDGTMKYNGLPLTNEKVNVTAGSFVEGEGATYTVTGSQTLVGTSDNTFNYAFDDNTKAQNYNVTSTFGTLEVTKNTTAITITADSGEWTYDGKAHTAGYSYTGVLGAGDELVVTVTGSITNVGNTVNTVTDYRVMRYGVLDVTDYYTNISTVGGTLTVNKAAVYLKSSSDTKQYDGTELTSKSMAAENGIVAGESFVYTYTGSQTDIGSSANTYTYAAGEGTSLDNYSVTAEYGTLEVVKNEKTIVIQASSGTKTYDGKALSNAGYTYTQGILAEGDVLSVTVEGTIIDAGIAVNKVTGYKVLRNGTEDVTSYYTFAKPIDGVLTVTPRNITLTSGSDSQMYDGTPLTNKDITVSGDGFVEGEDANYIITGSQTLVGSSDNTFNYTFNENTKAQNYNVTSKFGTLEVTKNTTAITITADSGEWTYDGKAHTAGYSFTQGVLGTGDELVVTVEGSITNVGSTANTVTAYKVIRGGQLDVTEYYTFTDSVDGTLTVKQADVYLKSSSATKEYDGQPLTSKSMETENGIVAGESFIYTFTGSQTDIGSSANTYTYAAGEGTNLDNYNITAEYGILTVVENKKTIVITANSTTKTYDGNALSNAGYTFTEGILAEGDVLSVTVEGTITDAGTAINHVAGYKVMRNGTEDVTYKYTFAKPIDGVLTVTPRNITLTSGSDSQMYDGTPLTNKDITVSGDGFVQGEGADYIITGSQTLVGTSSNTFNYTFDANTKSQNYNVTSEFGPLEVTQNTTAITITADSGTWTYDGTAHTAGYSYTGTLAAGDQLVVTVTGSITDAGSTANTIAGYKVIRGGVLDVTDYYTNISTADGTLTVNKANVYLKSGSATKQYDGTELTCHSMEIESGIVEGESFVYTYTGSQTAVGNSKNNYTYAAGEGTNLDNYKVTAESGTLTVINAGTITIKAVDAVKIYDGTELTDARYSFTPGILQEGDRLEVTVEGSITDAGVARNHVAGYEVWRGSEIVTDQYTFADPIDGVLAVRRRDVTLTSGSAEKTYDGTPLTCETVTVTSGSFVGNDGATYSDFASQTEIGSTSNTFTYTLDKGTNAANYCITTVYGTLEVTDPDDVIIKDDKTIMGDGEYYNITVKSGKTLTIDDGATVAVNNELTLDDGGTVVNNGKMSVETLVINGQDNVLDGNVIELHGVKIDDDAALTINKNQYDYVIYNLDLPFRETRGLLTVTRSVDNPLREADVQELINKENLHNVEFQQDLFDIHSLTFLAGKDMLVSAQSAYGTPKDDVLRFSQGAIVTFGTTGYAINMEEGNNTVQIDANANVTLKSSVTHVSQVKIDKQATVTLEASISFAADRDATLKVGKNTTITAETTDLNGPSAKKLTVTTDEAATVVLNNVNTGSKDDKISIGKASSFTAMNLNLGDGKNQLKIGGLATASLQDALGLNKLTLSNGSYDKQTGSAKWTKLEANTLGGTAASDTFSIGQYADAKLNGTLGLGDGSDTLKLGNYGKLTSGDILSADTVSLGAYSTTQVGNLDGTKKLTISNGSKDAKAMFNANNLTGMTGKANSYKFGNYNTVGLNDVTTWEKNDTVQFGNYSNATAGEINLGTGKDTFKVGSDSVVKVGNVSSDALTMSIGSRSKVTTGDLAGLTKLTVSNGTAPNSKKGTDTQWTTLSVTDVVSGTGAMSGTDGNDTVQFGNYNNITAGDIALKGGKDTFKVGSDSVVKVGNVSSDALTMSIGSRTDVTTGDLAGLTKLTVSNGTAPNSKKGTDAQWTKLDVQGEVTGTIGNDTLSFGNYADVNIHGLINFNGGSKDTVTVGQESIVVLKSADTSSLTKFTIGKNSDAYLSSEMLAAFNSLNKADTASKNNIGLFDIGDKTVAVNFQDIDTENSDDTFDELLAWDGSQINGWLDKNLDDVDCIDASKLTGTITITGSNDMTVWNEDGTIEIGTLESKTLEFSVSDYKKFQIKTTGDANTYSITIA